jgi:serine/threonine protein kinase
LPSKPAQDLRTLFPKTSAEGIDLLRRMLSFNPRKRITAEEALKHPFFAGILPKPDHIVRYKSNSADSVSSNSMPMFALSISSLRILSIH